MRDETWMLQLAAILLFLPWKRLPDSDFHLMEITWAEDIEMSEWTKAKLLWILQLKFSCKQQWLQISI